MMSGCKKSAMASQGTHHRGVTNAKATVVTRQTSIMAISEVAFPAAVKISSPASATNNVKTRLSLAVPIKPIPRSNKITPRPASKRLITLSGTTHRFPTARHPAKIARAVAQWRDTRPKPKLTTPCSSPEFIGGVALLICNLALCMGYSLD